MLNNISIKSSQVFVIGLLAALIRSITAPLDYAIDIALVEEAAAADDDRRLI
ncbi:hypothetical protein [Duganella sp. BuS-21]|uniref:hypothetical protein n=1 Tax=Duganella sp. BuS-21 TaxID=2943848 RepID=UPI0035A664E1